MKQPKKHSKVILGTAFVLTSALLISCTKKVDYLEVPKPKQVHNKSEIDTSAEYLYVASSDSASRDDLGAASALPFWQGQEKVIKFRFTEKSLQALEVEEESRLKDNSLNSKILLEIPIDNIEYRCAMDRYKKCTNQEEENRELPWDKRTKFLPDFDGIKSVGFNMLPVEMEQVFGMSCYTEVSSRFLNYELTEDSLNIQVEKSFRGDLACLSSMGVQVMNLNDLQSQIVFHYSFNKLNALVSKNYQKVTYPVSDENTFGFFTTEKRQYDVDFGRGEKDKVVYMNRWNPERQEIVYHLSDNFNKPELSAIKKSTQKAFAKVNEGLAAAGVQTRLILKDPSGKKPGDTRNNMIILVEDPINGGPLGYGPSVANPRTGEILSGRVVMYHGNMLQNIRYTYDEVLRELRAAKIAGAAGGSSKAAQSAQKSVSKQLQYDAQFADFMKKSVSHKLGTKISSAYVASKNEQVSQPDIFGNKLTVNQLTRMSHREFEKATLAVDKSSAGLDALSAMSKHCNYPAELFPFDEAIKNGLQSKLGEELKPWNELNDSEKQDVIALIGPEIWEPTLVHELGHNLGLRHNFNGSEDKENFYSKEELAKMGVKHEIPYSSVMDYGYSELNLLPTLGKYDIAALKFAFKREVETADGRIMQVKSTLADLQKELSAQQLSLKDFKFCTDGHVDVNPTCKRFDKGTTSVEVVKHLIQSYNDMYNTRNFRNGRENFSMMSDAAYINGTRSRFRYIRGFMERYSDLKNRFGLKDDSKEWNEIPWLKDLKESALISGRFFLEVLQTPDLTCAFAKNEQPNTIAAIMPLSYFDPEAMNCFSLEPDGYKVLAQFGKSFKHRKDPGSDNNYADQIDMRGYFLDKIAATEALFARRTGNSTYDRDEDNYVDMTELTEEISSTINALLLDQVVPVVTFHNQDGLPVYKGRVAATVFSAPADTRNVSKAYHWIQAPLDKSIAKVVGIPMQSVSFQQVMLGIMDRSFSGNRFHYSQDMAFMENYRVIKTNKAYNLNAQSGALINDFGGMRVVALPENGFSQYALQTNNFVNLLKQLKPEQLEALMNPPAEFQPNMLIVNKAKSATVELPEVYKLIPKEIVRAFKENRINDNALSYLVTILPEKN